MKKQLKDMRTLFLLGTCLLIAACTGRSSQASNDDESKAGDNRHTGTATLFHGGYCRR